MPKTNRKPQVSESRRAFVRRYGPMETYLGYGGDIAEYNPAQFDWWNIWEAARKWQRAHPKEK